MLVMFSVFSEALLQSFPNGNLNLGNNLGIALQMTKKKTKQTCNLYFVTDSVSTGDEPSLLPSSLLMHV